MDCQREWSETKARSGERLPVRCSLAIANGIQVGEGWVFDVSTHGCLVESPLPVKMGDRLQLRLCLPEGSPVPFICVSVAVVRWAQGRRFGVEFVKIDDKYRAYLKRFTAHQADPWARAHD